MKAQEHARFHVLSPFSASFYPPLHHNGKVPLLQVEVKAVWLGQREGQESSSRRDKMVDRVMGVRKPTYKRSYNSTRLNGSYLYNSITMMMVGQSPAPLPLPRCPVASHLPSYPYSHTRTTPSKNSDSLPQRSRGMCLPHLTLTPTQPRPLSPALLPPLSCRSAENIPLKSNRDGSYSVAWVPSTTGAYIIQVFIDGRHTGTARIYCDVMMTH